MGIHCDTSTCVDCKQLIGKYRWSYRMEKSICWLTKCVFSWTGFCSTICAINHANKCSLGFRDPLRGCELRLIQTENTVTFRCGTCDQMTLSPEKKIKETYLSR